MQLARELSHTTVVVSGELALWVLIFFFSSGAFRLVFSLKYRGKLNLNLCTNVLEFGKVIEFLKSSIKMPMQMKILDPGVKGNVSRF